MALHKKNKIGTKIQNINLENRTQIFFQTFEQLCETWIQKEHTDILFHNPTFISIYAQSSNTIVEDNVYEYFFISVNHRTFCYVVQATF